MNKSNNQIKSDESDTNSQESSLHRPKSILGDPEKQDGSKININNQAISKSDVSPVVNKNKKVSTKDMKIKKAGNLTKSLLKRVGACIGTTHRSTEKSRAIARTKNRMIKASEISTQLDEIHQKFLNKSYNHSP